MLTTLLLCEHDLWGGVQDQKGRLSGPLLVCEGIAPLGNKQHQTPASHHGCADTNH